MPLKEVLNQSHQIKLWLAGTGYAAPAIFMLVSALLTAIGMPRLLLCTLAGVIFGFTWGFVLSHFGTVVGAYGAFIFARWSGREFVQKNFQKLSPYLNLHMHEDGDPFYLCDSYPLVVYIMIFY